MGRYLKGLTSNEKGIQKLEGSLVCVKERKNKKYRALGKRVTRAGKQEIHMEGQLGRQMGCRLMTIWNIAIRGGQRQ